jgi:hypothetical protein
VGAKSASLCCDIFSPPHARILLFLAAGAFLARCLSGLGILWILSHVEARCEISLGAHMLFIYERAWATNSLCAAMLMSVCARRKFHPAQAQLATRLLTKKSLRSCIIMRADFSNGSECCSLGAKYLSRKCALESYGTLNGWNARPSTTCWICTTRFFISLCKPRIIIVYERSQAVNGARANDDKKCRKRVWYFHKFKHCYLCDENRCWKSRRITIFLTQYTSSSQWFLTDFFLKIKIKIEWFEICLFCISIKRSAIKNR